jgi:hypothetical protein
MRMRIQLPEQLSAVLSHYYNAAKANEHLFSTQTLGVQHLNRTSQNRRARSIHPASPCTPRVFALCSTHTFQRVLGGSNKAGIATKGFIRVYQSLHGDYSYPLRTITVSDALPLFCP